MNCRHCHKGLEHRFLDLGCAPPSNAYLTEADRHLSELFFPLRLYVCSECWLVQTEDYACPDELFKPDYAYFSSTSTSWLEHAARYCDMIRRRLDLSDVSFVIEVASNDGYLLKHFVKAGVPCLGIEPTASTADAAERLGIPVLREFFGEKLGRRLVDEGKRADLLIGNNVYAHVPDINDFTAGLKAALKPGGTITLEFPHLMRLIEHNQFDTVYHEHYSYFSLRTVCRIFRQADLRIFDVDELPTHGGSLRVYGCHAEDARPDTQAVSALLAAEERHGLRELSTYLQFQSRADTVKNDLLAFLIEQQRQGKRVAGYGAAAKGNTLLNYAGVKPDLLPYVVDRNPAKQGKYLPGSRIPIVAEAHLRRDRPDRVLILPWNLREEIVEQLAYVGDWGGTFVLPIPTLAILNNRNTAPN